MQPSSIEKALFSLFSDFFFQVSLRPSTEQFCCNSNARIVSRKAAEKIQMQDERKECKNAQRDLASNDTEIVVPSFCSEVAVNKLSLTQQTLLSPLCDITEC